MADRRSFKTTRLSTNPDHEDLAALTIGDVVYLDGVIYTAREKVYQKVVEDGARLPMDLPGESAANFHCSPAAAPRPDGGYSVSAVTATASFRFAKWLEAWFKVELEGILRDAEIQAPADEELAKQVASFRAASQDDDRELLLQAFSAQAAIDWPALDALLIEGADSL